MQNTRYRPRNSHAIEIFSRLRDGQCLSDDMFDSMYTDTVRKLSTVHWTPVQVAHCATKLLTQSGAKRILDVGCGPGKFCLVGAATHRASFFGIEQRRNLFVEAEDLAIAGGISNATFMHGNMIDLDWSNFDAFYLFNPFLENVCNHANIDKSADRSFDIFFRYIEIVRSKLMALPIGTRVVTYHGFGGDFPDDYRLESEQPFGTDFLECWIKARHLGRSQARFDLNNCLRKSLSKNQQNDE